MQFSTSKHFRIDYVNFNIAYHAILGRLALAKPMAMPHYTYLVLKMLTEQGILSLRANLDIAYAYEKESFALTEATNILIRMQDYLTSS